MGSPNENAECARGRWRLASHGGDPAAYGCVLRPEKLALLTRTVVEARGKGLLARGLGRSYGDAALNPEGETILMERLNRMISFDDRCGVLCCESGVTFADILRVFVPRGWFPPVVPGTPFVSIGGAVACDVHGQNHHRDGSFGEHVRTMKVLLASGETVTCAPDTERQLLQATIGGLGLTGIITEIEVQLRRIETAYVERLSLRAADLEQVMSLFEQHESRHQYSAAWVDCLGRGRKLGRSIVMFGSHAPLAALPTPHQQQPFIRKSEGSCHIPFDVPVAIVTPPTLRAFNLVCHALKRREQHDVVHFEQFFYRLGSARQWSRRYGKPGVVRYQCVFPLGESRAGLVQLLELCSRAGGGFCAVLKKLGPQYGWLSFPMAGYALALDFAVKPGVKEFLETLDRTVVEHGGRVYLAQDARVGARVVREMYPKIPNWEVVKGRVDPVNVFSSALSRRLDLRPM